MAAHVHFNRVQRQASATGVIVVCGQKIALSFLKAVKPDPLYPAFVLLPLYGMRRGEVLGLRWAEVDLDAGHLRVRQQVQRIHGELRIGPVKTRAASGTCR